MQRDKIVLTEEETKLFEVLLGSVKWYASRGGGEETILRVAGGWVRDKVHFIECNHSLNDIGQILMRESHDIDIALNDRSGVEFANTVNEYLSSLGQQTRTIAVIQVD